MLLGVVSRLAIMMGYHHDPQLYHPQISNFEAEMLRRAWLILITIDSVLACHTGLPKVISRSLGDVSLPRNLLDSDFSPETTVLPPRPADEVASSIVYMSALEQMLSVSNEVSDMASCPSLFPKRTLELNLQLENNEESLAQPTSVAVSRGTGIRWPDCDQTVLFGNNVSTRAMHLTPSLFDDP
ncbi:hypothetical protein ABHI18_009506 [Aspergillus niger]